MADPKKRLSGNTEGEFFVDSTCINCDTCRQLAPKNFQDGGEYSQVFHQPENDKEKLESIRALISCPTGSIGMADRTHAGEIKNVMADFPLPLEGDVYYSGFNSPKSFGGNSYFVKHTGGNWLIDSPKYVPQLVEKFEKLGGIAYIFLTHKDDVAEAEKYAEKFGSKRIIHEADQGAQPDAEIIITGSKDKAMGKDFLIIPTPGHTKGHCVLLYKNRFLFTGDHLGWDRETNSLDVSEDYCWYSFPDQLKSVEKLQEYNFEWVLPGHGQRVHLPAERLHKELAEILGRYS